MYDRALAEKTLSDPSASYWLKEAIRSLPVGLLPHGNPYRGLQALKAACLTVLERRFPTHVTGQTRLEFSSIDEKEFSLIVSNPSMPAVPLEMLFPQRHSYRDGSQVYIDFLHPHSKADVLHELLHGLVQF